MNCSMEKCKGHIFLKGKECSSERIALYIYKDNRNYPICNNCWIKIGMSNMEWSSMEEVKPQMPHP